MRRERSFPLRMTHGVGRRQAVNRQTWLSERRAQAERSYTANAPTYDEREPSSPVHAALLARIIASVDVGGTILDAPCGTGRYMDAILGAGRRVVGIDQSAGMLEQARLSHPDVPVEHACLQELAFHDAFDAAICIDAMEYVPPEDWPVVLGNLRRAVRLGGLVYLTVEEIDRSEVDRAYADAVEAGLPVVPGEHHRRGGGYHFYPTRDQVAAWLAEVQLEIVAQDTSPGTNYAYWHLLTRRSDGGAGVHHDDIVAVAWAVRRHELTLFLAARANPGSQQAGGPGSRCGSDQRAAMPRGSRRRASASSWAIGPCRPGEVTRASSILDLAPVEYARRPTRDEVAQRLTTWTTSGDPPAASKGIDRGVT
jgi:SAM-dependent methyltransferase